jgi:hypothetical protein
MKNAKFKIDKHYYNTPFASKLLHDFKLIEQAEKRANKIIRNSEVKLSKKEKRIMKKKLVEGFLKKLRD